MFEKRFLLKIAINLFSIPSSKPPSFGGEIDILEKYEFCEDEKLTKFCNAFIMLCNEKKKQDFINAINEIEFEDVNRLSFFKTCCFEEIKLIMH